ncbi:MAG: AAA family ATPase [Bdellovibrionaceae bacterium]|nr:AAA family ATPase [Pseudobdellovibrionaceae bacterium]
MDLKLNSHSKILIVGTSGSGKSTLARRLSKKFNLIDIELDALFWKPNWTETPQNIFREDILNAIAQGDGFVIHGNYNKVRDITWANSEIVIWLDYPKWLVMWRVSKRSILRLIKNEVLWSGNQETFQKTFLSKSSIILWAWNTYALRRQQYLELIKAPEFEHLKVIHITNPNEIDRLIFSQIT